MSTVKGRQLKVDFCQTLFGLTSLDHEGSKKKKVRFSKSIFTAKNAIMIFCKKYFIRRNTNSLSPFLGKIVTEETLQHSIETLQHTEIKEANILPDKYDLFFKVWVF